MTVNGVEQVRMALLALPASLELSEGDTSSHTQTLVADADERMCASIRLVADHIADNVITSTLYYTPCPQKVQFYFMCIFKKYAYIFDNFWHGSSEYFL